MFEMVQEGWRLNREDEDCVLSGTGHWAYGEIWLDAKYKRQEWRFTRKVRTIIRGCGAIVATDARIQTSKRYEREEKKKMEEPSVNQEDE